MSKKLKITEGQLQKLMERKHSYRDNSPEGEVEEQSEVGPESAIINLDKEKEVGEQVDGEGMDNSDRLRTKESILFEFEGKLNELISLSKKIDKLNLDNRESWRDWVTNELISLFGGEDNPFKGQRGGPTVSDLIDDELGRNQEDEEDSEEDEMMNESIKAIKANFKRFL